MSEMSEVYRGERLETYPYCNFCEVVVISRKPEEHKTGKHNKIVR